MGYFIYVSHRDTVEALVTAKELMIQGHFPFVPQLNRLIQGRQDAEWENYFKMWLFRCDAIYLTPSFRPHEKLWAMENKIPIVNGMREVLSIKLPPFGELGRKFGERVAEHLDPEENWRKKDKKDVLKDFENAIGIGHDPLHIGALALVAWDRKVNG